MRGYESVAFLFAFRFSVLLRIPMRGYEVLFCARSPANSVVTHPHEGL